MTKVFVDGSSGTTGLKILDRLAIRNDVELILLDEALRKDVNAKAEAINSADIVFLCLPDQAAIEAANLVKNDHTVVIDTSTAHRVDGTWVYGFEEILNEKGILKNAKKIANPGCHASGFLSLVAPLTHAGLISKDVALTCFSLTGYSGGGKKMINQYENEKTIDLEAPRQYGLTQSHKHIPEMMKYAGLTTSPIFCPIVADFAQGMQVTVPLFKKDLKGSVQDIIDVYKSTYTGKLVHFDSEDELGFITANKYAGYDDMGVSVFGNEDKILLVSRFDNLGKGASGAAIQNMNIVMGLDETTSLDIKGAN